MFLGIVWWGLACAPEADPCVDQPEVIYYADVDVDGYGAAEVQALGCAAHVPEGFVEEPTDCDDRNASVHPFAYEICDGLDNDCNRAIDDGLSFHPFYLDADGDGYGDVAAVINACSRPAGTSDDPRDCDDRNAALHPEAVEICDGIDNDCDALVDDDDPSLDRSTGITYYADHDLDGFGGMNHPLFACVQPDNTVLDGTDCDDENPLAFPGLLEVCDGVDNDCDGLTDDSDPGILTSTQSLWFLDHDQDGLGAPGTGILTCTSPWYRVQNDLDCDDEDPQITDIHTVWLQDQDGDGYGAGAPSFGSCAPPHPGWVPALAGTDCDDSNPNARPGLIELCDGIDNNCSGLIDDDDPLISATTTPLWTIDEDGDGFGGPPQLRCHPPENAVGIGGDCDDTNPSVFPGQEEVCNHGIDDDCNGFADDGDPFVNTASGDHYYLDRDGDGHGDPFAAARFCSQPPGRVSIASDCDDSNPSLGPPTMWWPDADGDRFGTGALVGPRCDPPGAGWVQRGEPDCDDRRATVFPGATDICEDGVDQDCDGQEAVCERASCKELQDDGVANTSGVYLVNPSGLAPREVYCDLEADGGGWTLVSSSTAPVDDGRDSYSAELQTLFPSTAMHGIWDGLRPVIPVNSDIRFACKTSIDDEEYRVDLVFYDIHWYQELTSGEDEDVCFNEDNGAGVDIPYPARRDLITGSVREEGNPWNAGYLEGEDSCSDRGDFTVDFDDRGMDSNQYDGTDWGEDDELFKCGTTNSGEAWFVFVR